MKIEEFQTEMDRMDACWPTRQDATKAVARREVLWERLQEFSVRTLQAARNSLIDSGLEFMPSVPEIVSACREAEELSRPSKAIMRGRYKEAEHTCADAPTHGPAFFELQSIFPYEAKHITCRGKIPATCPLCGAARIETGIFEDLIRRHPQETANWNPVFKGLMVCLKCERRP